MKEKSRRAQTVVALDHVLNYAFGFDVLGGKTLFGYEHRDSRPSSPPLFSTNHSWQGNLLFIVHPESTDGSLKSTS